MVEDLADTSCTCSAGTERKCSRAATYWEFVGMGGYEQRSFNRSCSNATAGGTEGSRHNKLCAETTVGCCCAHTATQLSLLPAGPG